MEMRPTMLSDGSSRAHMPSIHSAGGKGASCACPISFLDIERSASTRHLKILSDKKPIKMSDFCDSGVPVIDYGHVCYG